mgnify:CR=1 FL=1
MATARSAVDTWAGPLASITGALSSLLDSEVSLDEGTRRGLVESAYAEAERLKIKYGCASPALVDPEEEIEVPSVGGRQPRSLRRSVLAEILEPRVEEIFQLVQRELQKCGYEDLLASGVVITGGSTLLEGMPELAEEVLGLPTRRGMPRNIGGLVDVVKSPMYATGVGLVLYGAKHQDLKVFKIREENVYKKVKSRMRQWLEEIF